MRKQIFLLYLAGLSLPAISQTDSLVFSTLFEGISIVDGGSTLFNGREHIGYLPSIEGTAYYATSEWQKGTLVFQDVFYRDALLKYDLVTDELVILHTNGFTGVTLFTPRIQSFTLGNKKFFYQNANPATGIKAGFYEEILRGKLSVFIKRSKLLDERIVSNSLEKKFVDNSSYFILKDGYYYLIKNEKAVIDLLGERKNEISSWMKASGIKYKSNPEEAIVKIIEHYNQLSR